MFWGIFETYSATATPSARKGKYLPIQVRQSSVRVVDKIVNYITENGYENIVVKKEYNDIYAEYKGFEISFVVSFVDAVSYIEISVYGEHKRGRTRGKLKKLCLEIKELFKE